MTTPTVAVTEYTVSLLPESNVNYRHYRILVQRLDGDVWRVQNAMGDFLSMAGTWSVGPWGTRDRWVQLHTFDLDTALRLARQAAPNVAVSFRAAAEVLAGAERPA